jgi:hypothetical protein
VLLVVALPLSGIRAGDPGERRSRAGSGAGPDQAAPGEALVALLPPVCHGEVLSDDAPAGAATDR